MGVGQESTLSPILLAFYLSPFLYILENYLKNLNISVSIISFMNDGLFISQNKLFDIFNSCLFYSYNVKFTNSRLSFSLFYCLFLFLFCFIFLFFYF